MSKRFKTQDYFRYPKLGAKWRKPKGRQSKLREKKGGSGMKVSIGYGTHGRKHIHVVSSFGELEKAKGEILIAGNVGAKKAALLAERAKQLGIAVLNMKKVRKSVKKQRELEKRRQEKKKEKQEKKEVKAEKGEVETKASGETAEKATSRGKEGEKSEAEAATKTGEESQ